jgi:hypothetical protein
MHQRMVFHYLDCRVACSFTGKQSILWFFQIYSPSAGGLLPEARQRRFHCHLHRRLLQWVTLAKNRAVMWGRQNNKLIRPGFPAKSQSSSTRYTTSQHLIRDTHPLQF